MPISKDLLEILRCPETGQKLQLSSTEGEEQWLITEDGKISYPIRNGLPMLVKSEAIKH